jgi:3-hydroxy-9,10-secoandrosta-1,3,5(10)-triene-9,17-dione monooxygenase reductase component
MSVNPEQFRSAMGHLAGGVAVVTTLSAEGQPRGFTATAVCSVSLVPPLVLVCVGTRGQTLEAIRESSRYALNFLHEDGLPTSVRFSGTDDQKFEDLDWVPAPEGSPLLEDALAWVECAVEQEVEAGDHVIFIGRVTAADARSEDQSALVHFRGRYHAARPLEE